MKYNKIINKLHAVGFDEFYQAGTTSRFHPLNIVAINRTTNTQYWICVDGGYRCPESFHIEYRKVNSINFPPNRTYYQNQTAIVEALDGIQQEINYGK